jgi:hypothetical protein
MLLDKYSVWCLLWEVSREDEGTIPWGYSLHLTLDNLQTFTKKHWASLPKETPVEYLRPVGNPYLCEVGFSRYTSAFESDDGVLIEGLPPRQIKENN